MSTGTFTVEFTNFSFFVHHSGGLSVIAGAKGHTLSFDAGGGLTPVAPGTDFQLLVDGAPGNEPTAPCSGLYMPNLSWIKGQHVVLNRAFVTGASKGGQNARIHLHGGFLLDEAAVATGLQPPAAGLYWDFSPMGAKGHTNRMITNRARFVGHLEPGKTYALDITAPDGQKQTVAIGPGSAIKFINTDDTVCPQITKDMLEAQLEHLDDLLLAVDQHHKGGADKKPVATANTAGLVVEEGGSVCQPCGHCSSNQHW